MMNEVNTTKERQPYRECIYQTLLSLWVTAFWARAMIPFIVVTCVAVHSSMGFTSDRSNSYSDEISRQRDSWLMIRMEQRPLQFQCFPIQQWKHN